MGLMIVLVYLGGIIVSLVILQQWPLKSILRHGAQGLRF